MWNASRESIICVTNVWDCSTEEILHNATNRSEGDDWDTTHYFGVELWVRNKLREWFAWDDSTLDQAWAGLFEEVARRYCWR